MLNDLDNLVRWALSHGEGSTVEYVISIVVFMALTVLLAVRVALTTNRWWHQRFRVERGVSRPFGFCNHCSTAYIRGR